jgi:O-Antigen ligase
MLESRQSADFISGERRTIHRSDIAATYCLCAIIALAPLPFGSMDLRIVAAWVLLLSAALILASFRAFTSRDLLFLSAFAVVALAWAFVVTEQLSPTPIIARELIPPIWRDTSTILGQQFAGVISEARNQPYFSAGSQMACMLSIVCGFLVGRNRQAAYLLMMTFALSSLIYSIYGILALTFWPNYLLWHERFNYLNSLKATFINPNVAAVYFGAATLTWLLILAQMIKVDFTGDLRQWRHAITVFFRNPSRRTILCFMASFTLLAATLMTGSRAGSILSLLAICGALATFYRRELGPRGLLLGFPLSAAGAIIIVLQIFAARVNQRFGLEGLFDLARWKAYLATLEIIKDHPWLGTGLGTFRWVFPKYRSGDIPAYGTWEQAHSTTLEIASEMGIPFTILIVVGWLAIFLLIGRGMVDRKRDQVLPIVAFWAGLLAVVHSQIDFSLQIPGFSLAICPLLGMGLAQSASSKVRP